MHTFPTMVEIEKAAGLLINRYSVSPQLLGHLFGVVQRDQASSLLQALGNCRLSSLDVARLLVQRDGAALFAGGADDTRKFRQFLLGKLDDETIRELYGKHSPPNTSINIPARMYKPLAAKKWHSGKSWAKDFVTALGFPLIYAGAVQPDYVPSFYDVSPRVIPPKLVDYQVSLKDRMCQVLDREGRWTRCVVTLPTGGGKTRVAVEAFIDWLHPRFAEGKYLIWIAQSEELCEQAIACIEQMWGSREFIRPLRVYRFFGGRNIPTDELEGGAVVASIHQLDSRIKSGDKSMDAILKDTGAVIIDEAHRAVSSMYDNFINRAEEIHGPELFPICGLTATPGRSGTAGQAGTTELVGRFQAQLVKPELGGVYEADPLQYFRDHNYLAKARHIVFKFGREHELTDEQVKLMKREHDLPLGFLKQLAADHDRNLLIVRRLLQLPKGTSTLVYACTVEHAYFLSAILNARGRVSRTVSSDTPVVLRRGLVQEFKDQKIEFLCNFGVLTTGFDAPRTDCIALCRPTTSEVLYEQIIGRGLRGTQFGGTPECTIIDFADNILRLGKPLAHTRFEKFWTVEESEEQ